MIFHQPRTTRLVPSQRDSLSEPSSSPVSQKSRLVIPGVTAPVTGGTSETTPAIPSEQVPDDIRRLYEKIDRDEEDMEDLKIVSFEVIQNKIETLRKT